MQQVQGITGTSQHADFLCQQITKHWVEKERCVSNQENKLITDLKFFSLAAHTHAGCLCHVLEIINTQLQQSENSTQNGESEGKRANTTHMKFNFYFSVDKTQRSLTAAIDAEVICRNYTSS